MKVSAEGPGSGFLVYISLFVLFDPFVTLLVTGATPDFWPGLIVAWFFTAAVLAAFSLLFGRKRGGGGS